MSMDACLWRDKKNVIRLFWETSYWVVRMKPPYDVHKISDPVITGKKFETQEKQRQITISWNGDKNKNAMAHQLMIIIGAQSNRFHEIMCFSPFCLFFDFPRFASFSFSLSLSTSLSLFTLHFLLPSLSRSLFITTFTSHSLCTLCTSNDKSK